MCDYSLDQTASRPAKVGDRLVSSAFTNSISRGFTDTEKTDVAVCLLPGTELAFDRDVECERTIGFLPTKKMGERMARFRKINQENPHEHHDALEFPDGKVVLLTKLRPGQHATVLQLPVSEAMRPVAEDFVMPPEHRAVVR
jgi:hypothetical protein